jgi:lipopolysaccharide export system protein LptA
MIYSLLASFLLIAAETAEPTSLSSSHAAYDGNALVLTGHVVLDHGLGKMQAENAALQRQEAGNDFPFSLIELDKQVVLNLKNSSSLFCDKANLDFTTLQGSLFSSNEQKVVFTDLIKKKIPVKLTGNQAELSFSKNGHDGKRSDYEIQTILAKEEVLIEYGKEFVLYADQALYSKQLPEDNKAAPREFQGIISASPKNRNGTCKLKHGEDEVSAASMDVDLLHAKVSMLRAKGVLASPIFPQLQKGALQFECEHLLWDQEKDILTLKGNAHLEEKNLGVIDAEDEIVIAYSQVEGKNVLKTIETKNRSYIQYGTHQLTCFGPIFLSRENLTASLTSPVLNGTVPREKQIYYQEGDLKVFADKAGIEYSLFGGIMQPVSLVLKDNVRLYSQDAAGHRRFALADRLSYSPITRTFILSALPENKVLFRDETEKVDISGQEVHITFDPATKKERIQGIGNIQLSLSADEINLLKKMFPTYE